MGLRSALWVAFVAHACASVPKDLHPIREVRAPTLKFRRPSHAPADPKVGPGGIDYRTREGSANDCLSPSELFAEINTSALAECARSIAKARTEEKPQYTAEYRLRYENQPYLELDVDEEETPKCLQETLPRIPVPRELVFEGKEGDEKKLGCYVTQLDIEADRVLGIRIPGRAKRGFKLVFPLSLVPASPAYWARTMTGWVVGVFKAEDGSLPSRYLPDVACRQCLGKRSTEDEDTLWDISEDERDR